MEQPGNEGTLAGLGIIDISSVVAGPSIGQHNDEVWRA